MISMNKNTKLIPITPAFKAFGKASDPSWEPTVWTEADLSVTGNAPALISPANVLASSREPLPVIVAFPSVIVYCTVGLLNISSSI